MVKVNRVEEVKQTVTVPTVTNNTNLPKHLVVLHKSDSSLYFLVEGNLLYSVNCVEVKGWFLSKREDAEKVHSKELKVSITIPLYNINYVLNLNFKSR